MNARGPHLATAIAVLLLGVDRAAAQTSSPPPGGRTHEHQAGQPPVTQKPLPPDLPPITDADRAAAFPKLDGQHAVHDTAMQYYVLFDHLEWQAGDGGSGHWDSRGWIGGDVNRFWFRAEGAGERSGVTDASAHALFGRAIHPWWDVVAGVRQDVRPGSPQTWAAIGIQGLAPYWFEVEATAYLGASGRTHFRIETEYELLLTNRLILQPRVEVELYGQSDPARGIGAGLATGDVGLRVRYEIRREIAPYIGIAWARKFFGTADLAARTGEATSSARLAAGARVWF